ncbi:element excision factor XisH family protein [Leptodesmis sichuanensis]|uniref:element excision factor XisH family protein n=1 Tax=Leptodesmis sichuanensis TaxID=2906798 RepID=UPI0036F3EC97|nr:hypothetical protein KIK02_05940 [Leptodesmis sichuanensis A121]
MLLRIGLRSVFVDLGAERLIAAERGTEKIAVEIKRIASFTPLFHHPSPYQNHILTDA